MKRLAAVLLLSLAPLAAAKSRVVRSIRVEWTAPQCAEPGLDWLRYVDPDGTVHGAHLYDSNEDWTKPRIVQLALGAPPNTLWVADATGTIHRSSDAGCTWSVAAAVPEVLGSQYGVQFASRHADRVYVYTGASWIARATSVVRLTGSTVETFPAPDASGFVALETDPADSLHLRAVGRSGTAWESHDGAATWTAHGAPSLFISFVRSVAFDPSDFNHMLLGTKTQGLWESRDGGRTWTLIQFAGAEVEGVRFAPSNAGVIYAGVVPSKLMRSMDGGKTFTIVDISFNPPWGRLYYMDNLFAVSPRDPLTSAAGGERGIGVKIVGPNGVRSTPFDNIGAQVWAPSGTIYYSQTFAESR